MMSVSREETQGFAVALIHRLCSMAGCRPASAKRLFILADQGGGNAPHVDSNLQGVHPCRGRSLLRSLIVVRSRRSFREQLFSMAPRVRHCLPTRTGVSVIPRTIPYPVSSSKL